MRLFLAETDSHCLSLWRSRISIGLTHRNIHIVTAGGELGNRSQRLGATDLLFGNFICTNFVSCCAAKGWACSAVMQGLVSEASYSICNDDTAVSG